MPSDRASEWPSDRHPLGIWMARAHLIGEGLKTRLIHRMCQFQYFLSFFEIPHILKIWCLNVCSKRLFEYL